MEKIGHAARRVLEKLARGKAGEIQMRRGALGRGSSRVNPSPPANDNRKKGEAAGGRENGLPQSTGEAPRAGVGPPADRPGGDDGHS